MSQIRVRVVPAVLCLLILPLSTGIARGEQQEGDRVVVHLSHFGNDLHAVNMALKLGTVLAESGSQVTLFVDLEGVRLADKRQPLNLRWGTTAPIEELYAAFVQVGGKILVCPHCAAAVGLDADSLRKGAELGTTESLAQLLTQASKILDY